jgi:hypothetical protein
MRSAPKPVAAINPALTDIAVYPSIRAAGRAGFDRRHIWKALTGRLDRHRGLWWTHVRVRDSVLYLTGGNPRA